jgi:hypothetical protein
MASEVEARAAPQGVSRRGLLLCWLPTLTPDPGPRRRSVSARSSVGGSVRVRVTVVKVPPWSRGAGTSRCAPARPLSVIVTSSPLAGPPDTVQGPTARERRNGLRSATHQSGRLGARRDNLRRRKLRPELLEAVFALALPVISPGRDSERFGVQRYVPGPAGLGVQRHAGHLPAKGQPSCLEGLTSLINTPARMRPAAQLTVVGANRSPANQGAAPRW